MCADFARHSREELREGAHHRRLGFEDGEVGAWCRAAGLQPRTPARRAGDPLTVVIWHADRPQTPASPVVLETPADNALKIAEVTC